MVSSSRTVSVLGIAVLAGIIALPGCATKNFVRQEVGKVGPQIQEVSNATKENAERIDAVDRRAAAGITAAQQAQTAADQANAGVQTAQTAVQAVDRKADTANQGVQQASTRINTLETRVASINVNDTYAAGETQTIAFNVNSSTLTDEGKATLDRVAGTVAGQRSGFMIELQGFTDETGAADYNETLSQRRAESVQRYLVSKNVPLYRVSIVGLGEVNPIADNKTRAGRVQNRRVEVKILKATGSGTN